MPWLTGSGQELQVLFLKLRNRIPARPQLGRGVATSSPPAPLDRRALPSGPALALFSFSENILPSLNPRTHVARFLSGCLNAQLPGCVLVTCKLRGLWTALVPLKIRDKPLNWEGTTSGYPADPEVILVQEFVYKPFINTVSCYQQIRNIFYSIEINICILAYEIVTTSLKLTVLSLVSCLSTLLFCSILYSK